MLEDLDRDDLTASDEDSENTDALSSSQTFTSGGLNENPIFEERRGDKHRTRDTTDKQTDADTPST